MNAQELLRNPPEQWDAWGSHYLLKSQQLFGTLEIREGKLSGLAGERENKIKPTVSLAKLHKRNKQTQVFFC